MTAPAPLRDRLLGGRYRLGARRGASVDLALFDAVDLDEQRPVAVKMLHPELTADADLHGRLVEALGAVADLRHPNLSVIYDWGVDSWNDRPVLYVVVEVLRGGSLRELLDRGRMFSASQTLALGFEACRGLDALHRRGLVHRDIRPANLVFGDDGHVRIVDVGVSSVLSELVWADPSHLPLERARYASPEQATGAALDAKTDVYSLCLSLVEAATGQVPFGGDSTVATLVNRVDRLMPVSADLGPLASVLERAGRPLAAERSTAPELGRALMQAAENLPRPAPAPILVGSLFADVGPADVTLDATDDVDVTSVVAGASAPVVAKPVVADPAAAAPADIEPVGDVGDIEPADIEPADDVAGDDVAGDGRTAPSGGSVPRIEEAAPRRRRFGRGLWLAAACIAVVAVTVVVVWAASRTPSHTVPAMAGLDQGQALNAISGLAWNVDVVREPSETVVAGQVIRTAPAGGTSLAEGEPLQLVISSGPAPRALPELVGRTLDQAAAQVQAMGLLIRVGNQPDDEVVPPGTVIAWSVPAQPALVAGDTVVVGTQIVVSVSNGPAPRTVVKVSGAGLGLAEATAALQQQQLVVAQLPDEFSDTVPAGQVARQDPPAGARVSRGTTVSIAVSKGPDLVAVPDLGALDPAGIRAALTTAGLQVGAVAGDQAQPLASATVAGGPPLTAGQLVKRGSAVDLAYPAAPTVGA